MSSWWRKEAEKLIAAGAVLDRTQRGSWPRIVHQLRQFTPSTQRGASWQRMIALDEGAGSAGTGSWPRREATSALTIVPLPAHPHAGSWPRIIALS